MYRISVFKLIESEPIARMALAVPALGALLGSVLLAFGGLTPCLLVDAIGCVCGLLILIGLLFKYLWVEHLLLAGEEAEAELLDLKDNPGISISQVSISHTTNIEYQFCYAGVEYKKRITVHLPDDDEHLKSPTVIFDPRHPEKSTIRELYCVPPR